MPRACALTAAVSTLSCALSPFLAAQQRLTLADAVELAQQRSHLAEAVRATRDAARYQHRAFRSELLPQLSLSGNLPFYNRSIIPVLQPDGSTLFRAQRQTSTGLTARLSQQVPFTGGTLSVQSGLSRLAVSGQQPFESWSSTPILVGLEQEIFRPNGAKWDGREETFRIEVAERAYREAREEVALEAVRLFFDLYALRAALDNAVKNAAVNDTLYALNQSRFTLGAIGENDLLQSELAVLRGRTAVDGARLAHDRAEDALRLLLRLPAGTRIELVVSAAVPAFEVDTAQAVAEALRNRAVVSEVALQEVQADRGVAEARWGGGVGATVNASLGLNATAPEAGLVYDNLLGQQRLSVGVSVPLWNWGARNESVAAARAQGEGAATLGKSRLEQAAHEARFAALELSQARRNLALTALADSVAARRFQVAYDRYLLGRLPGLDNLFIAQSERDQVLTQLADALRGYWQAYYDLRRVTLFDFERNEVIR